MDDNADVADGNEPEWIIEAKPGKRVAGSCISESNVPGNTTQQVEGSCRAHSYQGCLLHHLVFW